MATQLNTIHRLSDDLHQTTGHREDKQRRMSDAEVMPTALCAASLFRGKFAAARLFVKGHGYIPRIRSMDTFSQRLHRLATRVRRPTLRVPQTRDGACSLKYLFKDVAHNFMETVGMKRIRLTVILLLMLFLTSQVHGQGTAEIKGVVTDRTTGESLPGASVIIEGTSIGSATNEEGEYRIPRVPAGSFVLVATYIGYQEARTEITVAGGEDLDLDIEMDFATVEGDEIVVTAQAEGQMSAINQQIASVTIKNVVSADKIQQIPDVNAAESVARLPGISLVRSGGEGQQVAVRGLSPKYNVMMVNGVRMQSTDRENRSVDLNMIAPNVLSGIEVTKALTADMDADAVGGTVNLKIGKAREDFHGNFSFQAGYGSLAETYGNWKGSALASNRFLDNKLGIQISGFIDDYNRNSDVLSAGYAINEEETDNQWQI
jgi:hypothetical protein